MPTIDLENLTLGSGGHPSFEAGACLLEAASYVAGEPWSDHPVCVSDVLGAFGRRLNDVLPDEDRQKLKPLIPRLLNTADDGQDEARRWMSSDWAIRVATPRWLDAAGLTEHAERLRSLPQIVDYATAAGARSAARAARDDAWSLRLRARDSLAEKIRAELVKRGFKAAAAAAAAAADVAAAAAADVAAAAAAAVAVAVAAAAAAAVAAFSYGSKGYWQVREAVYEKVKAALLGSGSKFAEVAAINNQEAIELLGRMIDPSKA